MPHWLQTVIEILQAETSDLRELARLAGGDSRTFYKGVDPTKLELEGQNLDGMELSQEPIESPEQLALELLSETEKRKPAYLAHEIKGARRQEERAALLLAEFLRDRQAAIELLSEYGHDRANLTDSVISELQKLFLSEMSGRQFSNVQIARRVSGRFARTVEKRAVLTYYFAKHLGSRPEIAEWLRGKSLGYLTKQEREEFWKYLGGRPSA
jgi:hypothetical protein